MNENIKTTLTEQHTHLANWGGALHMARTLLQAAFRYTERENITEDAVKELDAIITAAQNMFGAVENEMDAVNAQLVAMIDGN